MLKIVFCLYRQWGFDIFNNILKYQKERKDFQVGPMILAKQHEIKIPSNIRKNFKIYIVDPNDTLTIYKILKKHGVDMACMYSWSWIVREPILSNFICLCVHPSLVPQNRGGTPIQNQIISGVENSGLSLFRMDKGIDSGPLYKQTVMSLIGNVNDIFSRMTNLGTILTKELISDYMNNTLVFSPQKSLKKYVVLKRRTPDQSELKFSNLSKMTFDEVNNLVRGLLYPYPNAFIIIKGKKYLLQGIEKYPKKPNGLSFKLKDCYAKLIKYEVG